MEQCTMGTQVDVSVRINCIRNLYILLRVSLHVCMIKGKMHVTAKNNREAQKKVPTIH